MMNSEVKKSILRGLALSALASLMTILNAGSARAQWTTSGTTTSTTNNVGIGTSTPSSGLEIQGSEGVLTLSRSGVPGKSVVHTTGGVNLQMSANAKWMTNAWASHDASLPSWNFFLAPNAAGVDYAGIRRAAPSASGLVWADIMRFTSNGNVGIGTATPGAKLDVGAGAPARGSYSDMLIGPGGNNAQLEFYGLTKSSTITHDESMGGLVFYNNGPAWTPSMIIANSGNVGVGTTAPATKLHVAGDITVDGNINAKYQDVAEWVPTTQKLAAGTVVVVDVGGGNRVLASSSAYDTGVAGVVSAQPGIALGERGEGKALVATTGRVKVRVDATRAPIRAGDLLVTSDVAGVAMKSVEVDLGGVKIHRPGTIIGKALEPLDKGTGEILVLLSLQ